MPAFLAYEERRSETRGIGLYASVLFGRHGGSTYSTSYSGCLLIRLHPSSNCVIPLMRQQLLRALQPLNPPAQYTLGYIAATI